MNWAEKKLPELKYAMLFDPIKSGHLIFCIKLQNAKHSQI